MVVVGWNDPTAQVLSVVDTGGNVYELAVGPTSRSDLGSQAIYHAPNVPAAAPGDNQVTVTFTAPAVSAEVRLVEYLGIQVSSAIDMAAAFDGNDSEAAGAVITTVANDLVLGATWVGSAATTAGGGLTVRLATPSLTLLEDRTVSTIGSYELTASVTPPSPWILQLIAFRSTNQAPIVDAIADQTSAENDTSC